MSKVTGIQIKRRLAGGVAVRLGYIIEIIYLQKKAKEKEEKPEEKKEEGGKADEKKLDLADTKPTQTPSPPAGSFCTQPALLNISRFLLRLEIGS